MQKHMGLIVFLIILLEQFKGHMRCKCEGNMLKCLEKMTDVLNVFDYDNLLVNNRIIIITYLLILLLN